MPFKQLRHAPPLTPPLPLAALFANAQRWRQVLNLNRGAALVNRNLAQVWYFLLHLLGQQTLRHCNEMDVFSTNQSLLDLEHLIDDSGFHHGNV